MNPMQLFHQWFAEALQNPQVLEPTAATLATATSLGRPSARVVLLKEAEDKGAFLFYTNYGSRKAQELGENPYASLCFYWHPLGRQIRIEGAVEQVSAAESEAYFATRPRESQIGAWASKQSHPCGAEAVQQRFAEFQAKFARKPVPRPEFWGGYRLMAESIEFWQVGEFRLHHRQRFERATGWQQQILFP